MPFPVELAGAFEGPEGSSFRTRDAEAMGAVDPKQLLTAMSKAAVFVAPSRYEPFGLAVLEAAATGARPLSRARRAVVRGQPGSGRADDLPARVLPGSG